MNTQQNSDDSPTGDEISTDNKQKLRDYTKRLSDLQKTIKGCETSWSDMGSQWLKHVITTGELLIEVRESKVIKHGHWEKWSCSVLQTSKQTISNYIKIAKAKHVGLLENCKNVSEALTIIEKRDNLDSGEEFITTDGEDIPKDIKEKMKEPPFEKVKRLERSLRMVFDKNRGHKDYPEMIKLLSPLIHIRDCFYNPELEPPQVVYLSREEQIKKLMKTINPFRRHVPIDEEIETSVFDSMTMEQWIEQYVSLIPEPLILNGIIITKDEWSSRMSIKEYYRRLFKGEYPNGTPADGEKTFLEQMERRDSYLFRIGVWKQKLPRLTKEYMNTKAATGTKCIGCGKVLLTMTPWGEFDPFVNICGECHKKRDQKVTEPVLVESVQE